MFKNTGEDFLSITSDKISHIDCIIMNPPFDTADAHILHAFNIAPAGCKIIALCNTATLENPYTKSRKELNTIIENYGSSINLGDCFSDAERKTGVNVSLIKIQKAGESYKTEFEGFFTDEEPEETGEIGIMSYDVVRDLVNRYVAAVKLYDQQLNVGKQMNNLLGRFYGHELAFNCTQKGAPKLRKEFKKDLQKAGWKFIFEEMNLTKNVTRGLMEDINKFVEQQTNVPFTMKNIYAMLNVVIQTTGQRMDKAILEVFDKLTEHHHDNRHHVEGWKTNSHYLVGKKFILPDMCYQDQRWHKGESKIQTGYGSSFGLMEDFNKALAYITGINYNSIGSLSDSIRYEYKVKTKDEIFFFHGGPNDYQFENTKKSLYERGVENTIERSVPIYGEWFDWGYFRCKAFKKGSMHFEWKDPEIWGRFNQRVAKLKGYPLYEAKEQTAYQNRQTGRKTETHQHETAKQKPTILATFKIKV